MVNLIMLRLLIRKRIHSFIQNSILQSVSALVLCLLANIPNLSAQTHQQAGNGNPIIPGYFADPTVKKFGDTYYIYATTDGNGGGFGPSQVWVSKDFVNWSLQDMNWPTTHHYWAPDVTQGADGKYYLYYCQPVEIFGASAHTPVGPWTSLLPKGKPIVPNFLVPNVITLDGQTFKDDDGKYYMYWGTWGIYPNHGCGVGLLNPDMKSFAQLAQIPNTVAKDFFEAPFMFKRKGIYYLTYSSGYCEDGSYRVQYATSKTGPMGPFVFGKNNPILATNNDGTVHGPGHESVLQQGDDFYMIYHRHNNPHSGGGYHRQIAADKITFDEEGNIEKITPSHNGVGFLGKNVNPHANLALGTKVKASSFYSSDFKPDFAVDDNNGTLWKAKNNIGPATLEIDLGSVKAVKSIHTQFEYATWYYQYLIDYSADGKIWKTYADRSKNTQHGSPMVDFAFVNARYLRLKILETEYPGLNKGVWNIKVFDNAEYRPITATTIKKAENLQRYHPQGLLVNLDASKFKTGETVRQWQNLGKLKGSFTAFGHNAVASILAGKKALVFDGENGMKSDFMAPLSLKGNSSFTVAMWVYNPDIAPEEPVIAWTARGGVDLTNAAIGYGSHPKWGAASHWGWPDMAYKKLPEAAKWHHIAITFDGTMEKLFVDGKLDREDRKMLFINNLSNFFLGSNTDKSAGFSGAISSLKLYDIPLTEAGIIRETHSDTKINELVYLNAAALTEGKLSDWKNEGTALGSLITTAVKPVVGIVSNHMGVTLQKDNRLHFNQKAKSNIDFNKPFSMALQAYADQNASFMINMGGKLGALNINGKGRWCNVLAVFNGKQLSLYLDGLLQHQTDRIKTAGGEFYLESKNSDLTIAGFYLYNYAFNATGAEKQYKNWKLTLPPFEPKAAFDEKPLALSPNMISMQAFPVKLPGSNMEYQFTEIATGQNSGWIKSDRYTDFTVAANNSYGYTVRVRDHFGNVSLASAPEKVNTAVNLFVIKNDTSGLTFDKEKQSIVSSFWDGLMGKADQVAKKDGTLTLVSTKSAWDGSENMGPFLYKTITGNFIAEVMVDDLSGLKEKKANGANDVGLMVKGLSNQTGLVQNSVMLGWNIGNITTNLDSRGRKQLNNASGWNFYKYLQIQRKGNVFYLRGSKDAKYWQELPGSPMLRSDWENKPVQVGPYQATYGENSGYGSFNGFKIIQVK
ncbi:family 43 glycosylhydrolase [Pedobacter sp. GSP4]|uniref:family 43 glycosylhydrolase n=1 Tax=Pedobacter sp. GSP4 TaxID=3453716 RepID=UPI003EEA39FF